MVADFHDDEVIHTVRQKKIASINTRTSRKTYWNKMVANDNPAKSQPYMSTNTVRYLLLIRLELTSYGLVRRVWILIEGQNYVITHLSPSFHTQFKIPRAHFHGKNLLTDRTRQTWLVIIITCDQSDDSGLAHLIVEPEGCSIGLIGHALSDDQDHSLSSVGKYNHDILLAPLQHQKSVRIKLIL